MRKPPECRNALLPDCFSPPAKAGGLKREDKGKIMYLTKAILQDDHTAILTFDADETRIVDFKPILKRLKNDAAAIVKIKYFMTGKAKEGFLQWENGYAIDPDALYAASKPYTQHQVASSFLAKVNFKHS